MELKITLIVFLSLMMMGGKIQQKKELAPTPPMGWNSWDWFGKSEINEDNMKQCMDAIVQEGLLDAGYEYFVIDGGWRDNKLGLHGELLSDPVKFPHGMKALADYAHSRGLKFGLHTVPGTHDCGGDSVGGFGHEEIQVKQFVDWGLDFIKLDKCKFKNGWDEKTLQETYQKWHDLLSVCGRKIVLSISAYTWRDWYPQIGQMARTTGDIKARVSHGAVFDDKKGSVMKIADINNQSASHAGNGYWNDPDMLPLGNQGLTIGEQEISFALWCIMSSPLMLGNDPRNMSPEEKAILINKMAISIDQDPTDQGRRIKTEGTTEIWAKNLAAGKKAVLLLNWDKEKIQDITVNLQDLGFSKKVQAVDVYTGKKAGSFSKSISFKNITPHACKFLLIE